MVTNIIRNQDFTGVARQVKVDSRRRVVLPASLVQNGITYHIYTNIFGQIVLDPQVTIPASEAWIFQNPEILALAKRGLAAAAEGRVSKIDLNSL